MILSLPRGYDTEVGENGRHLSAGQRQRIALARALYGSPRLVLLDEPNSNLDADGEEALLGVIKRLKADGVTVIIATHRPSAVAHVDRVLVLRDGAIEILAPRDEFVAAMNQSRRQAATAVVRPLAQAGWTHDA
jgi:ABC-type protease/lipase transport system fused ATPase/permease subunit